VLNAWLPGRYEVHLAPGRSRTLEVPALPDAREIAGPWEVSFPPGTGAPPRITLDRPASLSEHPDPGVRHFSGTAAYRATFTLPSDRPAPSRRLELDLGRVEVMARVALNGKDLGLLWKPPYRLDVTDALVPGENRLEVAVTNLWPNRLIGDEFLPEDSKRNRDGTLAEWPAWLRDGKPSPTGRLTFSTWQLWKKTDPVPASGLVGPVRLVPSTRLPLEPP
jgi:hypothetical protein